MTNSRKLLLALATVPVGLLGCSDKEPDDGLGVAEVALVNAPADVRCVRINIVGTRTVVKNLDISPGASALFRLTGLPVGTDEFSALAFESACGAVGDTDPA